MATEPGIHATGRWWISRTGSASSHPNLIHAALLLSFKAAWGPDGAVCVRRTRIAELLSTAELAERYPHLIDKIGPNCSEGVNALLWNRS